MQVLLSDEDVEKIIEKLRPMLSQNNKSEDIFDKKTLAKYLKVDVSWLDKKVSANEIPFFKVGKYVRFRKSDIDKWIDGNSVPSTR